MPPTAYSALAVRKLRRPAQPAQPLALQLLPVALIGFGLVFVLAGCDSDDDGGAVVPPGGNVDLQNLSGRVVTPDGVGISGATVEFEGNSAFTDGNGVFILPQVGMLSSGTYPVRILGSTAGNFADAVVPIELTAGDMNVALPQFVTVADLNAFDAGQQSVSVDLNGATLAPIAVSAPSNGAILGGEQGTLITIDGLPAAVGVDLAVAELEADELANALPNGLVNVGAVSVLPGNAGFTAPGGGGIDLTLPQTTPLTDGTLVDIWRFDEASLEWVNVSAATGLRGTAVSSAAPPVISAPGIAQDGGTYAAVLPAVAGCATTLNGSVLAGGSATPEGVTIVTNTGQVGSVAADGSFSIPNVAAYDPASGTCSVQGLSYTIQTPPALGGAVVGPIFIDASNVVPGGITDGGEQGLGGTTFGCVAGLLNGAPTTPGQAVQINGPTFASVVPHPSGTFSTCGLAPGSYTASYTFAGSDTPTTTMFDVEAFNIATVTLQFVPGTGQGDLEVSVLSTIEGAVPLPVAGATVTIVGTDSGSVNGIDVMTDASGVAVFNNVDGPFQITARAERVRPSLFGPLTFTEATTVSNVTGVDGRAGVLLGLGDSNFPGQIAADATLTGSVVGNTGDCPVEVRVTNRGSEGNEPSFEAFTVAIGDSYTLKVPADAELDLIYADKCGTANTVTTGAGQVLSIAPIAAGQTRVLDLGINSGTYVAYDNEVPNTVTGQNTSGTDIVEIDLVLADTSNGAEVEADLFFGSPSVAPGLWNLPDFGAGSLAGLDKRVRYQWNQSGVFTGDGDSQSFEQRLDNSTPTFVGVELMPLPALTSPGSPVVVDAPSGLFLDVSTPAGPAGSQGFDALTLRGTVSLAPGSAEALRPVVWTIVAPAGADNFVLPAVADQILAPASYTGELESTRFTGTTIDYSTFFSGDVATNLDALEDSFVTRTASTTEFQLTVNGAQ